MTFCHSDRISGLDRIRVAAAFGNSAPWFQTEIDGWILHGRTEMDVTYDVMGFYLHDYPLVNIQKAIENGHL
jgi:hypothetical protein